MEKIKIEIIGSNSFLAKNFIQYILANKLECKLTLYDVGVKEEIIQNNNANKIEYKQIDFEDKNSLGKIAFDGDAIFIFTGKTGTILGFEEYENFIQINEVYLLNVLTEYVKKQSKAKIIYPSTRLLYKEDKEHKITEDAEKKMKSIYAVTKYAAEKYLELYHDIYGVEYCIFRICTPYGTLLDEFGNYGTFEFFTNQAKKGHDITVYGEGSIIKTYTHIIDICEIFWKSISCSKCSNDTFNIGGEEKTLLEIATKIAKKYDVKIAKVKWPELNKKVDGGSTVLDSTKLDKIMKIKYKSKEYSENY